MGGKMDSSREAVWRERLERQLQGPWSVAEFCRREGVSQPAFYHWRRRLQAVSRKDGGAKATASGQPRFVPVELPPSLWATDVRIELPGGAVVRLPQGVSAELLAAAVRASCRSDVQEGHPSC